MRMADSAPRYWLRHPSYYSAGAGVSTGRRKRLKLQLRVLPATKARLVRFAVDRGETLSRVVESLIEDEDLRERAGKGDDT